MSSARGGRTATNTNTDSRSTDLTETVARLIERSWKGVVIVIAAVAVIVLFFVIWEPIQSGVEERGAEQAEIAQAMFDAWQAETDAAERDTLAAQLTAQVSAILDEYDGRYAAERALYIRGQFHFEQEDWQLAENDWMAVVEAAGGSYLAGLALYNAAIAAEEAGDPATAIARLQDVVEAYTHTPLPARALFGEGRIRELAGDVEAARAAYQQLEEVYPGSDWATQARNRILSLGIREPAEG